MKILRVTSDLYPFIIGGIGVHTHEMSESLTKLGYSVIVFTFVNKGEIRKPLVSYSIVKFNRIFTLMGNSIASSFIFHLLKERKKYDIIHAHSHLFLSTNFCALIRTIGSSPLIITNHGLMSASAPEWFNRVYLKTLGRWTLNTADRIICYTQQEKQRLVNYLQISPEKIHVIPNGINSEVFKPDQKLTKFTHPRILWVGRFVPGKGLHILLSAIRILVKEIPDLEVILIGEGPFLNHLQNEVKKYGLESTVKFKSVVPYDKMPNIYQSCNVFILPSFQEGVPRTMLEAMSCGKPVIISDFPHLRTIIGKAGIMFPIGDVEELIRSIRIVLNDIKLATNMGEYGRKYIMENHSWTNTVQKTSDLYEQVMIEKGVHHNE